MIPIAENARPAGITAPIGRGAFPVARGTAPMGTALPHGIAEEGQLLDYKRQTLSEW